jgi:hypothetical protein
MVDLGQQTATIINLHQRLAPQNSSNSTIQKRFLILTQTYQHELCGIPIETPPTMLDLPLDKIQPLPSSYRQGDALGSLASHVAVLPESEGSHKIFLLGTKANIAKTSVDQIE